jgi:hypothetical protein
MPKSMPLQMLEVSELPCTSEKFPISVLGDYMSISVRMINISMGGMGLTGIVSGKHVEVNLLSFW